MARSKITKKIKLSRHRRRHRRNLTRSGGTPARRSLSRSSASSHSTPPHHDQAREFIERLRVSNLKYYSIESVAALAHTYSDSTNVPEKISNIVKKSSCGNAHTISELIKLASESGQISGTKQITKSDIDEIFKDCMFGLDKLDAAVVLRLCIKDFFGPCQSGGVRKPPRASSADRSAKYEAMRADQRQYNRYLKATASGDDGNCCQALMVLACVIIAMMFFSGAGRFVGGP